jgi:RNA polymerase sigma-70 factor (ECF subfamily)
MRRDSTTQLLDAASAGDATAFRTLVTRCRNWLERWASGRLPAFARDGVDTRDVVQGALVFGFPRALRLEPRDSAALRSYLVTVVRNRIADLVRTARRHPLNVNVCLAAQVRSPAPSPLAALLASEEAERIRTAVDNLGATDQTALIARYDQDFSYEQIGFLLGRSPEAARKVVVRATRRFAEELARAGGQR